MAGSFVWLEKLTMAVVRWPKVVLALWFLAAAAMLPIAPRFLDAATISFDPPKGTPSYESMLMLEQHFPALVKQSQFVGMITDSYLEVSNLPGLVGLAAELESRLNASRPLELFFPTAVLVNLSQSQNTTLPGVVSSDGGSMIFCWTTSDEPTSMEMRVWGIWARDLFRDLVSQWVQEHGLEKRVEFAATMSAPEMVVEALEVVKADFERVDLFSLPLAVATLYMVVGSGRLLLLTGAALGVSTVVSCGTLLLLSSIFTMEAITPTLVMALLVALSVDYSLFILTRFCEELVQKQHDAEGMSDEAFNVSRETFEAALKSTMATSGATIVVSGVILVVAMGFLATFPVNLIANLGIGCSITLIIMMAVNLTMVPALMALFFRFFTQAVSPNRLGARCCRRITSSAFRERFRVGSKANVLDGNANSCWHTVARRSTERPTNWLLLLGVVVATVAVSLPTFYMTTTVDMRQNLAHGSDLYKAADKMSAEFGDGILQPYNVLLLPKNRDQSVLSPQFFYNANGLLNKMRQELEAEMPEAKGTGFYFLSYISSPYGTLPSVVGPGLAVACHVPGYPTVHDEIPEQCGLINMVTNTDDYMTKAPTATIGFIVPPRGVDTMAPEGERLLRILRKSITKHSRSYSMDVGITGTSVYATDMVRAVYDSFPKIMIATLGTATIFMGITFKSLVLPLRAMVSNVLTLGFAYGIAVAIYQFGWLDWLHWNAVSGDLHALPWIVPVVVFFILTGLGLDYDIFLCVRITECRAMGIEPIQAIRSGLVSTAGIITSAGLVMCFAFGAMVFSSMLQLNMVGFMMILAVLYDTFVARSVVNPAVMSLIGYYNWWPSPLSEPGVGDKASLISMQGAKGQGLNLGP